MHKGVPTYSQDTPISNTSIRGVLSTIFPKGVLTPDGRASMALLTRLLEQPTVEDSNISDAPEAELEDNYHSRMGHFLFIYCLLRKKKVA